MTGEITLRGRVLPIGGLKSKILAAHLSGAKMVILPRKNEKDLRDIPEEIRKQIKLVLVEIDGPGAGGGAPAQAEAARRPSRPRSSRATTSSPRSPSRRAASGARRSRPPTSRRSSSRGDMGAADRPSRSEARGADASVRRCRARRTVRRRAPDSTARHDDGVPGLLRDPRRARGRRRRPTSRRRSGSSPASTIPTPSPATRPPSSTFKDVNEANDVLSDPEKRKQYDQLGANWEAFSRRGAGASAGGNPFARVRGLRRAGRPGRQRPLRVPRERRRRRVLRLLPDVLRGRAAGLPTWPTPAPAPAGPAAAPGRSTSRTSWPGWGQACSPAAAARRSSQARPGCAAHRGARRDHARGGLHGTERLVEVDGKRLEVTIPPGVGHGQRGSA